MATADTADEHIRIRPISGGRSVPWLVALVVDDAEVRLSPQGARDVANTLLEMAAVCEYDQLFYRVSSQGFGMSIQEARDLMQALAVERDKQWDAEPG